MRTTLSEHELKLLRSFAETQLLAVNVELDFLRIHKLLDNPGYSAFVGILSEARKDLRAVKYAWKRLGEILKSGVNDSGPDGASPLEPAKEIEQDAQEPAQNNKRLEILKLVGAGTQQIEVARSLGVSKGYISQTCKRARTARLMNESNELTNRGVNYIKNKASWL